GPTVCGSLDPDDGRYGGPASLLGETEHAGQNVGGLLPVLHPQPSGPQTSPDAARSRRCRRILRARTESATPAMRGAPHQPASGRSSRRLANRTSAPPIPAARASHGGRARTSRASHASAIAPTKASRTGAGGRTDPKAAKRGRTQRGHLGTKSRASGRSAGVLGGAIYPPSFIAKHPAMRRASILPGVRYRQGGLFELVEAAGVEPASGNVTGEATPCSASSEFSSLRLEKRQNGGRTTPD